MSSDGSKQHLDNFVQIGMYKEDLERLKQAVSSSTCRSLSEYCRKLLLNKPVSIFYRSQSFDAFIEEAIALRKEMETMRQGGMFTPDGEKRLIALQEEIKQCINKIYDYVRQDRKEPGNG